MAGMLPGVELARRRRFHQSGAGWLDSPCASSSSVHNSTRRSSFCLYPTNHESHLSSISPVQRSRMSQAYCDQKLGDAAREAKERLDGRLRAHWNSSEPKRDSIFQQTLRQILLERRPVIERSEMRTEVRGIKKSGSKRFSFPKFGWNSSEQSECTVCLEQFKEGEKLLQLPCAHRFHSRCLVPWLETNAHCPCCRLELSVNNCTTTSS